MTIRDHYIVVPVTPAEVQFERESVTQQLAKLPVVGLLVQAWFAPRSEEEFDANGSRTHRTASTGREGIREIEGCSAQGRRRRRDGDAARVILERRDTRRGRDG